jgi:hypothetical protein
VRCFVRVSSSHGRSGLGALGLLLLAACDNQSAAVRDAGAADRTDPRAAICANAAASGATTSPSFAVIQQIFIDDCVDCHTTGSDLDLSPGVSWNDLIGQAPPSSEACGKTLVVPGDPSGSYLYQKLSSDAPCAGLRMPRTEFGSAPLPACVLALVHDWIASGAPGPGVDAGGN